MNHRIFALAAVETVNLGVGGLHSGTNHLSSGTDVCIFAIDDGYEIWAGNKGKVEMRVKTEGCQDGLM